MNIFIAIAIGASLLREFLVLFGPGRYSERCALMTSGIKKPRDERTAEEKKALSATAPQFLLGTAGLIATIILVFDPPFVIPALMMLVLGAVSAVAMSTLPKDVRPTYIAFDAILSIGLFGWMLYIGFLA